MKNLDKKLLAIIVILIIIVICLTIMLISNQKGVLTFKTQIIKEMSESTQLTDLQTQINTLNASHEEYAKNVQAYKTKIAEAITNQEVPTSADAKTEIIVENIGKILQAKTTATATAAQILKGQTAWVNGSKITGTMVDRAAVTKTLNAGGSYTIPAGYHNGSGKVTANSLASQTQATATADNISEGKTAYVNGELITGTGKDNQTSYENGMSNASYGSFTCSSVSFGYNNYSAKLNNVCIPNFGWTTIRVWGNVQYIWINGTRYGGDATANISNSSVISISIQGMDLQDTAWISYSLN